MVSWSWDLPNLNVRVCYLTYDSRSDIVWIGIYICMIYHIYIYACIHKCAWRYVKHTDIQDIIWWESTSWVFSKACHTTNTQDSATRRQWVKPWAFRVKDDEHREGGCRNSPPYSAFLMYHVYIYIYTHIWLTTLLFLATWFTSPPLFDMSAFLVQKANAEFPNLPEMGTAAFSCRSTLVASRLAVVSESSKCEIWFMSWFFGFVLGWQFNDPCNGHTSTNRWEVRSVFFPNQLFPRMILQLWDFNCTAIRQTSWLPNP